ncbi:MAG: hypothetical protein KC516_00165 [Nanoarchaeota archaeon]|nr:hypothetical protein [Nanoarchaeota archaeon]
MGNPAIDEKIKFKTGITKEGELYLYKELIEEANLDNKIIMFGGYLWRIQNILRKGGGGNFDEYKTEAKKAYNQIMKGFEEKGLIDYIKTGNGTTYPRLIGYTHYDDPEFYVKIRRKGDENWTGRTPKKGLNRLEIIRELHFNYEFEEKEFEQSVLN